MLAVLLARAARNNLEQLTYAELRGLVQRLGTAPPCSNRKWTESVNTLLTAKYCPEVQRLICTCASDVPSVLKSNLDMLARERHALQYARQVQLDQTMQPFVFNVNVSFDKQSLQLLPQGLLDNVRRSTVGLARHAGPCPASPGLR